MPSQKQQKSDVDALGALRDRIHALTTKEKALTATVLASLKAIKKGPKEISADRYSAELQTGTSQSIEDMAALRRVAGRKFLKCIKASIAACRSVLGADTVDRIATSRPTTPKVRICKSSPGAKAPRKAPR